MSLQFNAQTQQFEYDVYAVNSSVVTVNGVDVATQTDITTLQNEINSFSPDGALSEAIEVPVAGTFLSPPITITNSPAMNIDATLQMGVNQVLNFSQTGGNSASISYDASKVVQFHNNNAAGFEFDQPVLINGEPVVTNFNLLPIVEAINFPSAGTISKPLMTFDNTGNVEMKSPDLTKIMNVSVTNGGSAGFSGVNDYSFDKRVDVNNGIICVHDNAININYNGVANAVMDVNTGNSHMTFSGVTSYDFDATIMSQSDLVQTSKHGSTSSRPVSPVIGQLYFDSTVGKPIWYNGTDWILADGTTV